MLVQTPQYHAGPLVYGDYGEGEGWYQETMEIEFDPLTGLGSPFKFKKLLKKIAHVTGGVMRIAAPFAALIPGIGIPAAAALAAGGTVIGKMLQRDKPLQVFKQKATLFQAGGAALATTAVGALAKGSIAGWLGGARAPAAQTVEQAEAAAEAARDTQMAAYGGAWGTVGDVLGQVGRTAVAGLGIYRQVAPYISGPTPTAEVLREEPTYMPGAAYPYMSPEFPGMEARVEGGVPAGSGAMMFPESESEIATAAVRLPIPLMLGAGALLFLLAPAPRRR